MRRERSRYRESTDRRMRSDYISEDAEFPAKVRDRDIIAIMSDESEGDYEVDRWARVKGWTNIAILHSARIVTLDISSVPLSLVLRIENENDDRYESQVYRMKGDTGIWYPFGR